MSDDLVKRLREHVTDIFNFRGNVMTAWDMVRSMIAKGDKSSGPRDIIESYLAGYAEDMKEAADRIEQLEGRFDSMGDVTLRLAKRIEQLEAALREIAKQKKTNELVTEYDVEMADFEDGYDMCIDRARAALAGEKKE